MSENIEADIRIEIMSLHLLSRLVGLALIILCFAAAPADCKVEHTVTAHATMDQNFCLSRVQTGLSHLIYRDPVTKEDTYYSLTPSVKVELNGDSVSVGQLQPGDELNLTFDEENHVTRVTALRTVSGAVVSLSDNQLVLTPDYLNRMTFKIMPDSVFRSKKRAIEIGSLKQGDRVTVTPVHGNQVGLLELNSENPLTQFWHNLTKNLFKPLLLFFYFGFLITLFKVPFDFPYAVYQGLTIYLLIAIGWHGGEELACLSSGNLVQAGLFMVVGFFTNFLVGFIAFQILKRNRKLRSIDAATVAAYYGSDSAGTFLTCLGVLQTASIAYAAYMPVMLATMEIPGCLLGLLLVSKLRKRGMDESGSMPGEPEYKAAESRDDGDHAEEDGKVDESADSSESSAKLESREIFREIFLNPGLFLLMGGIAIGFISRLQGPAATAPDDQLFVSLFQGMLCLFLLEMGMNAAKRIRDLKVAGNKFIAFGILAPNIFASIGIGVASIFSHAIGQPLQLGTYALFAVLCASASYIAVPAIQRLAIPEASPTLPLAASLGLTFTYNVTIGIPLYIVIAETCLRTFPVM